MKKSIFIIILCCFLALMGCNSTTSPSSPSNTELTSDINASDYSPETSSGFETEAIESVSSEASEADPAISSQGNTDTPSKNTAASSKNTISQPANIAVAGVKLDITSKTLDAGGTFQLKATVTPSNAANRAVTWSSNSSAAVVDNSGKVSAKSAGQATITVTAANGKTASCTVTVNNPAPKSPYARPFDMAKIKEDIISYAAGKGMRHITHQIADAGGWEIHPHRDGVSWTSPQETWPYTATEKSVALFKRNMREAVDYWYNRGVPTFTYWVEADPYHPGDHLIYIIVA